MTRQRLKDSNKRTLYQPCNTCSGTGWVKSLPISTVNIFRKIKHLLSQNSTQAVTIEGSASLIEHIQNKQIQSEIAALTLFRGRPGLPPLPAAQFAITSCVTRAEPTREASGQGGNDGRKRDPV